MDIVNVRFYCICSGNIIIRSLTTFFVGVSRESANMKAKKIFCDLDVNGDGELSVDEFIKGCMEDEELVRLLNAGGIIDDLIPVPGVQTRTPVASAFEPAAAVASTSAASI